MEGGVAVRLRIWVLEMIGFILGRHGGCPDQDMKKFRWPFQTNSGIVYFICATTIYIQMLYNSSLTILPTIDAVLSCLLTASQKKPQNFQFVRMEQTPEYLRDCDETW